MRVASKGLRLLVALIASNGCASEDADVLNHAPRKAQSYCGQVEVDPCIE